MSATESKILPIQAFTSRQFVRSGKDVGLAKETDETIEVRQFVTEPARVSVEMGMTVNLGNYESARVTVMLTVPCHLEEHEEAYSYAKAWVNKRTLEEAQEARSFAQNRSGF